MKKLSFVLALIIACGALAACKGNSDGTTAPKGSSNPPKQSDSAKTTQKPGSTAKPGTTKPAETTKEPEPEDQPKDELIDGTKFKVDGDLTEWTEQKLASMTLKGEADTANKSVTFYGAMTTTGLYMACEAYHDDYVYGQPGDDQAVLDKDSFVTFVVSNATNRFRVYSTGLDSDGVAYPAHPAATSQIDQAVMKTAEINDATRYRTVMEVFIPTDSLPEYSVFQNTIGVGICFTARGEVMANSEYASDSWGIPGYRANEVGMVATPKGLFGFDEYFTETE